MYNDILTIGPVTIHGYGLMILIGLWTALFVGVRRARNRGLDADEIFNLTIICAVLGFLGAKLLFCFVEWEKFSKEPLRFLLKSNGYVVYGGIIAGVLAGFLWCRFRKLPFLRYFDVVMPSVAIAQGFGRLGCFLAGCCYGRETDSWFRIVFQNSDYAPNHVKLIPTQLISSGGMFLVAAILIYYARKKRNPGCVGFLYLILYSIGRFGVEFLRNDYRGEIGIFSTSQFLSLFTFVLGICGFMIMVKRKEKNESDAGNA